MTLWNHDQPDRSFYMLASYVTPGELEPVHGGTSYWSLPAARSAAREYCVKIARQLYGSSYTEENVQFVMGNVEIMRIKE